METVWLEEKMCETINCPRYTEDAWFKTFPGTNKVDYWNRNHPDNAIDFLAYQLHKMEEQHLLCSDSTKVNMVTINDEYFKWLKEQGLRNDESARYAYGEMLASDEEKLNELAKAENFHQVYTLMSIPVVFIREEVIRAGTKYILTEKQVKEFEAYFEGIYGKGNVFCYGYFCDWFDIQRYEEKFLSNGRMYFEKGIRFEMPEFKRQRFDDAANFSIFGIPFLIKGVCEKQSYTLEEIDNKIDTIEWTPEALTFLSHEEFSELGIRGVKNFEKTDIYKQINSEKNLTVHSVQVSVANFESYYRLITDNIVQQFDTAE